jgi:hypothetical protein
MFICRDTLEMLKRLKAGDADIIAFPLNKGYKDVEGTTGNDEGQEALESQEEAPEAVVEDQEPVEPDESEEEPEAEEDQSEEKVYDEDGNIIGGEEGYTDEDWAEMEEIRRREAEFAKSGLSASDYMIENGIDNEWMDIDEPDEGNYDDTSDYDILSVNRDDVEEYLMTKGKNYLMDHPLDRLGQYFQYLTAGYDPEVRNDVLGVSRKQETWCEPEKWKKVAGWQDPNSVVYDNLLEMRTQFLGKEFVEEHDMHEITMVEIVVWFAKKFDYDYGGGEDKYVKWMLENLYSGLHERGDSMYKVFNDALEGKFVGESGFGFVVTPIREGASREDYGDLMHQFWQSETQFD